MDNTQTVPTITAPEGGVVLEFTIQDRLRKARDYFNKQIGRLVTQDEFAEMIGCSGATVGNYELGVTRPEKMKKIYLREWAAVTGVNYRWLVGQPSD